MSAFNIACLFIRRKHLADSAPELIVAWDEYSIEENWHGWGEACAMGLASVGEDLHSHRYVNISIPAEKLEDIFAEYKTIAAVHLSQSESPEAL